jgi:hypothetical protein
MSGWKPYVEIIMKDKENVAGAGIYGDNGAAWAEDGVKVAAAEAQNMIAGVKDNKVFTEKGCKIGADKYMFLRAFDNTSAILRKGPTSLLLFRTKKAIVVVKTKDGANPANNTSGQFVAADLTKKGF